QLVTQATANALRRAEKELSERRNVEQRLQLALDAGQVGVWDHELPAGDLHGDDRTFAMLGLAPPPGNRAPFEAFRSVIHPDDLPTVMELHRAIIAGSISHVRVGYRIVRPDGVERELEASAATVLDESGRPIRAVGTLVDVTEQREAEREREKLVGE